MLGEAFLFQMYRYCTTDRSCIFILSLTCEDAAITVKFFSMQKKLVKLAFLVMLMVGAGSMSASAQLYVTVRPVWHPVVRPVAPSPRHVWIDEEWEARGGTY